MFPEIEKTHELLKTLPCPYWIAGGWAVDMFLGTVSRPHQDIEIALDRAEQGRLLLLPGLQGIEYVEAGEKKPWRGQPLRLPVHELYARFYGGETVEILLNEFDEADWIYRRNERIRLPREKFAGQRNFPIDVVLLYKSRHTRPKDTQDFDAALERLSRAQKDWLCQSLALDVPGHPWLAQLNSSSSSLTETSRGRF